MWAHCIFSSDTHYLGRVTNVRLHLLPPPPLFFLVAVTKKYLKNQKIKEYVRVVSCKGGYEMKYFNIQADGDEVRTTWLQGASPEEAKLFGFCFNAPPP